MADTYQVYRAFISSPGDVLAERQLAEEAIHRINHSVRDTLAAAIDPVKWEHRAPVAPDLPEEKLQDVLNREVRDSNFFILILNKRYGSVEEGHSISNTEREINTILALHEGDRRRRILAYFRELDPNSDPGEQETKVRDLRTRLGRMGLPYRTYREPNDFVHWLTCDLYDVLLRIFLAPHKQQVLKKFWQFGDTGRPYDPSVGLFYPPSERVQYADAAMPDYWMRHLIPQISFEDFKAIEKVHKAFRILNFRSHRLYPHTNPPAEMKFMNRVWFCLPRNRLGLRFLHNHPEAHFEFPSNSGGRPSVIRWKPVGGTPLEVASPLNAYLTLQRSEMSTGGEWHPQLGRIVAKDYAVLARLQRKREEDEADPLWDYFFAGIRGLGTWGSAWFVDREYKKLERFQRDEPIELLLEVVFRDGRISEVTDVSTMPADYFARENSFEVIEEAVNSFRSGAA